jgi:ParB/RepB/Spo0J family partition protein
VAKQLMEGERKDKMRYVKLGEITVEDRAREDYGDLEELMESIKEKGVLQPITLALKDDGTLKLLAGGRRYESSLRLGLPTVPAIIREGETEITELEIELIENVHRKDFTWVEKANLTDRIDQLYKSKDSNWSGRKTAILIDRSKSDVNRDIQLARAMTVIPELGECKTADDALKRLKKIEEGAVVDLLRKRQAERIETVETDNSGNGLDKGIAAALRVADSAYIVKDCFEGMAGLKTNGSIQIIECDPPYGIELNEQKAGKDSVTSTVTGYKEVERDEYAGFLKKLAEELFRVAGKDCWLVFWYGQTHHQLVLESLRAAGWLVDEIPAAWVKPNGQTLQPELYYARCWEPFFLCRKGKPVMAERGRSNVFQFNGASNKYHPTQRPLDLIEAIFKTLSVGNEQVFVPFLGSGATLRAAFNMGLRAFGYDLDGKYKDKFMLAVEEDTRENF